MFVRDGVFGVCSRNLELCETDTNAFWKTANAYNLKEKMLKLNKNLAIQCELYGNGIQGNPLNIPGLDLAMFNAFNIDKHSKYVDYSDMIELAKMLGLKTADVVYVGQFDPNWNIAKLIDMAKGKYVNTNTHREGIVIRPMQETYSTALKGRLSFKVINVDYLLAKGD
jgi:RNA ligase (TIGR02306 family)